MLQFKCFKSVFELGLKRGYFTTIKPGCSENNEFQPYYDNELEFQKVFIEILLKAVLNCSVYVLISYPPSFCEDKLQSIYLTSLKSVRKPLGFSVVLKKKKKKEKQSIAMNS